MDNFRSGTFADNADTRSYFRAPPCLWTDAFEYSGGRVLLVRLGRRYVPRDLQIGRAIWSNPDSTRTNVGSHHNDSATYCVGVAGFAYTTGARIAGR